MTGLVSVVTHDATAYLPLSELVDLAAERERIAKELEKAKNGLRITEGKLANEKFVAHAPENVVNGERRLPNIRSSSPSWRNPPRPWPEPKYRTDQKHPPARRVDVFFCVPA